MEADLLSSGRTAKSGRRRYFGSGAHVAAERTLLGDDASAAVGALQKAIVGNQTAVVPALPACLSWVAGREKHVTSALPQLHAAFFDVCERRLKETLASTPCSRAAPTSTVGLTSTPTL